MSDFRSRHALARVAPAVAFGGTATALLWLLPALSLAANRLVSGAPAYATELFPVTFLAVIALALTGGLALAWTDRRQGAFTAILLLSGSFLVLLSGIGAAANEAAASQPLAFRARPAAGGWSTLALLASGLAVAVRRSQRRWAGWLTLAGLALGAALLARSGRLSGLSLMVEYQARREATHAAMLEHVGLSLAALTLAVIVCLILALSRRLRGLVELTVSGIQVVPAVALLGGLVPLLSMVLAAFPGLRLLGIGALGAFPAILGIAAYLLLPLWRGLQGALRAPDPSTLDAAAALGLTPGQILRNVRLPLGAPQLVGGLRVASVQCIGLATLGALVGAGGLGRLVFDGMAQFAPDLILLGALPIIALSLAADHGLGAAEGAASRRWRS